MKVGMCGATSATLGACGTDHDGEVDGIVTQTK